MEEKEQIHMHEIMHAHTLMACLAPYAEACYACNE
jgi:hypothetical protein